MHGAEIGPSCFVCGERVLAGSFAARGSVGGEILRAQEPRAQEDTARDDVARDDTAQDDTARDDAAQIVCGMCERARPHYERALAYGPYDGALRDLVHLLKYARVHTSAPVLGRMLAEAVVGLEIPDERVLVVPVPLYQAKQRQRGFNQALAITQAAMKRMAVWAGLSAAEAVRSSAAGRRRTSRGASRHDVRCRHTADR